MRPVSSSNSRSISDRELDGGEELRDLLDLVDHHETLTGRDETLRITGDRRQHGSVVEAEISRVREVAHLATGQGRLAGLAGSVDQHNRRVRECRSDAIRDLPPFHG
jgi:hypothetical protein